MASLTEAAPVGTTADSLAPATAPVPADETRPDALRRWAPVALAALLAAVYLIWSPPSIDLAATEYRTWLFGEQGLSLWDLQWYAGHHMPGYSLLLPPLSWLFGPRLLGAICMVLASALFARLAYDRYGARAWLGALWFAAGSVTVLLSGRVTFALGLAPALGALVALERSSAAPPRSHRRRALAALSLALGLLTGLASPVAAVFLAMAGTAYALGERWPARADRRSAGERLRQLATPRRVSGLALAATTVAPVAGFAVAFPEGGKEPFVLSAYWPVLAVAAAALALFPREQRTLRIAVVLYALGCTAAFVLETPVGGNAARLGALCAGPIFALLLWRRRPLALALLALPLLYWQWTAAVHDVTVTHGDASVEAAYYAPLLGFLDRADPDGSTGRVEIPFTKLHWEARWVAPHHALARGWERQLDHKVNPVFYEGTLTAERYRGWLLRSGVRWVALPDTRFDYSAREEARLVADGLPYLREVWSGGHWRVFEVDGHSGLASGPARVVSVAPDRVVFDASGPGTVRLRMHWTPYWRVAAGDACVAPAPESGGDDLTELRVRSAGRIVLDTSFALSRVGTDNPRCSESGRDPR
ncbi:hypothetical protein VSS74_08955 [Conexibacter stalactiti]|uniref:Glycosyltransferase RgtA/B/C/D-like domain-containing protein n=1 Tax=Conexibacter stalactiti TaxID=1940611 RepID=A0ABU4HP23_9ACTN|nr:hypothetical protein [Conexibacter stalactiti]MDW5594464.1 hypothetical protein [Conexibacter stalactiti]MEC5035106.1 hypothetical protein [Conexibacter stalactiti]